MGKYDDYDSESSRVSSSMYTSSRAKESSSSRYTSSRDYNQSSFRYASSRDNNYSSSSRYTSSRDASSSTSKYISDSNCSLVTHCTYEPTSTIRHEPPTSRYTGGGSSLKYGDSSTSPRLYGDKDSCLVDKYRRVHESSSFANSTNRDYSYGSEDNDIGAAACSASSKTISSAYNSSGRRGGQSEGHISGYSVFGTSSSRSLYSSNKNCGSSRTS
jgi:hypothetical protein